MRQCLPGFIDCNENNEDGCDVNLFALNMSACETCTEGYANCDNDWSNGCEIKLDDYGLKSCKECTNDYTNCGLTNNDQIALCLQEGKYEKWTWYTSGKAYTTDWGWGDKWFSEGVREENGDKGYVIQWNNIIDDPNTHICQYLCNVDYGREHPHYKSSNNSNCYLENNGKLYHQCTEKNTHSYWTIPSTCQPKQKCYLTHAAGQTFYTHCGD